MKKTGLGLIVVLLFGAAGAGYFIVNTTKQGDVSSYKPAGMKKGAEIAPAVQVPEPMEHVSVVKRPAIQKVPSREPVSERQLKEMEQKAVLVRSELDGLIRDFDQHLADPQKRAETKQAIDQKLDEYNRAVLPVAISAMEARR